MWIFSAGMPRSGSTLQFQITADLIETAGLGRRLSYARTAEFPAVRDEHRAASDHLVFKTHRCSDSIEAEFAAGRAKAVYTFRDLRDVYASRMRMREVGFRDVWREGFLDQCIAEDAKWRSLSPIHIARYEDMIADLPAEVERLAHFLGLDVDRAGCEAVAERYSFDEQQKRMSKVSEARPDAGFDPEQLLHGNHLTAKPGSGWEETLSADQAAKIERYARDWLRARGYPLNDPDPSLMRRLRLWLT